MSNNHNHWPDDDDDTVHEFVLNDERPLTNERTLSNTDGLDVSRQSPDFDNLHNMSSNDKMYSEEIGLSRDDQNDLLWDAAISQKEVKESSNLNNENGGQSTMLVRGFSLYESDDGDDDSNDGMSVYNDVEDKECFTFSDDEDDDLSVSEVEDSIYFRNLTTSDMSNKNMEFIQEELKSFVPNIISFCPEASEEVVSHYFDGYFLLADISGFTKLSSTLCAQGSKGLDKLRSITNNSFRSFIDIILMHGGDVIAFAGDALICVFQSKMSTDDDHLHSKTSPEATGHTGLAAIACAKDICGTILNGVQIHCGLTYGTMCAAILGGYRSQYAVILNGKCTEEIGQVLDTAVVVSASVYQLVREFFIDGDNAVESLSSLDGLATLYKVLVKPNFDAEVTGISARIQLMNSQRETRKHNPVSSGRRQQKISIRNCNSFMDPLNNTNVEAISSFLTKPVVTAVYTNGIEDLAEIRTVTTMFLNLNSYSGEKFQDLCKLQPFFMAMQKCLHAAGGLLRQFLVDDKGCVLIALWGVPTASYPCNSTRAIKCGVLMREAAKSVGQDVSIGITTGSVYCGAVGSPMRREYVAIGRTVNLAARLMGKAKGRVLVDPVTYSKLSANVTKYMAEIEPLMLKGIPKPVICYEFNGSSPPHSEHEKLDAGTIVIEKYLKKCITDVFDSHKFLNGRIMGLQVQAKEGDSPTSGEHIDTERQSLKPVSSNSSVGHGSGKHRPSKPVHKLKSKGHSGSHGGSSSIVRKKSSQMDKNKKRRQSIEATSFLTTRRKYAVIDTSTSRKSPPNFNSASAKRGPSSPVRHQPTSLRDGGTSTKRRQTMEFEVDWSGFFVIKGGSGSGKTMIAGHIIRQYDIVRQLQTDAISKFNQEQGVDSPAKTDGDFRSPKNASYSDKSGNSVRSGLNGSSAPERRLAQGHINRDDLLRKIHSSKDVHNWVPFVPLDKNDGKGFSAIRKIFKSMLLHTGLLATADEEKEEIVALLHQTYPRHTKVELMTLIFPFIRKLMNLQWHLTLDPESNEFIATPTERPEQSERLNTILATASQSSTFIHKNESGSFVESEDSKAGESNETQVLGDVLATLLHNNIAMLVIDDAHFMSSQSWRIMINVSKKEIDALIILTLLVKETLRTDKSFKLDRAGLQKFSETEQERTMLEMAHTAGRSMAKGLIDQESELDFCQDEYDELKGSCIYVPLASRSTANIVASQRANLVSSRQQQQQQSHSYRTKENFLHELKIEALTPRVVEELMKTALMLDQPLNPDTIATVMNISHGNPFLIWKVIRFFNESDYSNIDIAIGQLKDNSLIVSLIEGLSIVQKSVLKYCATIGEEFNIDVLLNVFPKNEKHLTRAQVHDVVMDLMNSGLIVRISDNYFRFQTSLIRKFIYALIPPSVAAAMHNDIASHIQNRYSNDSKVYSSLSYHYTNSSNSGTNAIQAYKFSLKTAEKYLDEMRLLEIMPFLQTCCEYMKNRNERNAVLSLVETCMSHIRKVANAKNSKKAVCTTSRNMDVDVLNEVLVQLMKLRTRLKHRFRSREEKCLACLLCCGDGGCFDLSRIKKKRQQRRSTKAKKYKMNAVQDVSNK